MSLSMSFDVDKKPFSVEKSLWLSAIEAFHVDKEWFLSIYIASLSTSKSSLSTWRRSEAGDGTGRILPAMSREPRDRYEEEALRLVRVLASIAFEKRVSVRSLEKKMGVGDSVFSKVLRGTITPQVRHVLMIADALEVGWPELFARAYGLSVPAPPGAAAPEVDEERMVALLLRLGVIDAETARRGLSSPEER